MTGTMGSMPRRLDRTTVAYRDVLSDDGTLLRAWTNDPEGLIDGPTVLLCNGLATTPWSWPALLSADCGVRVVSWAHRGTVGSDRPANPDDVGVRQFVEDALSVMDHFGLSRPVVVGWSVGVNIAFELAAAHPERVSGLFAVAGVPGDTFSSMLGPLHLPRPLVRAMLLTSAQVLKYAGRALTPITSHVAVGPRFIELAGRTGVILPFPDPEIGALALKEFLSTPAEWYFHLALRTSEQGRLSLRRIKVPVMFVAGSRDLIASSRHMAAAAARVPFGTFVELRGSHFLQMEQPERVHQLLLDFLRQTESESASVG